MNTEFAANDGKPELVQAETEVWLADLRLMERRRLTRPERTALVRARRNVRLASLAVINFLAAVTWLAWTAQGDFAAALAGITSLAFLIFLWLEGSYWKALHGAVSVFGRTESPGSLTRRLLTTGDGFSLEKQSDGSFRVRLPSQKPRTLALRPKDSLFLSEAEIQEIERCKKRCILPAVVIGFASFGLVLLILGAAAFEGFGVIALLPLISLITLLAATRYVYGYNARLNEAIVDRSLVADPSTDRVLLSNGIPWTERGKPAQWRRDGTEVPRPHPEDSQIVKLSRVERYSP